MVMNQYKAKDFSELEYRDCQEFQSKLLYAILRNTECFEYAKQILEFAEKEGVFGNAKFGIVEIVESVKPC